MMEMRTDPMHKIKGDFDRLIKAIKKPVAIFIDDLDRCDQKYVVRLLEGIQTLLKGSYVLYVIAADRKWISSCFEDHYKLFAERVPPPGHRLGDLFVEKAFQLSARVPRLSPEAREKYFKYLLLRTEIDAASQEENKKHEEIFRTIIKDKKSEDEVLKEIKNAELSNKISPQLIREMAIEQLSSREIQKTTEHSLEKYAILMEPNPRSMKRLVNFYSIYRETTVLEGVDIDRSRLVRWLIISMRWPMLAECLEKDPNLIKFVTPPDSEEEINDNKKIPDKIKDLFSDNEVRKVVHWKDGGDQQPLDEEAIRICTGNPES